ncbi:MAG TPA: hypothetical protein K8W04_02785 [Bacteroides reticulotermitis]|nr:hypothetical protein [Bacteroides reticulotermitis]
MNNTPTPKITLEDIARQKAEVLNQINVQKIAMTSTARAIFAPLVPAATKADSLMRSFNTGMAVFDGVVLGIKMMRKIRRCFRNF